MSDPSGRIAIDITSSANVAEVAKARSEVSALGVAAQKSADVTRQAWQEAGGDLTKMAQIYQRLTTTVQQTTTAVAQQTTVVRESEAAWGGFAIGTRRMQSAFVGVAFAAEGFTRSIDAGDGALRRVFRSISMLGFLGGPELGIATTAIAAIGDAMVDMWGRSEKAARSAQLQFQKTLETISRGSLEGAAREQQYLYSGDPFARRGAHPELSDLQFRALSGGQQGLEADRARITAQIARDEATSIDRRAKDRGKALSELPQLRMQLDAINAAYTTQVERVKEAGGITDALTAKETERARAELQRMRERAAERERQRLRPEEVPLTIGDLADQERAFGITGRNRLGNLGVRGFGEFTPEELSVSTKGLGRGIRPAAIIPSQFMQMNEAIIAESEKTKAILAQRMGTTLGDGLAAGIRAGFSGSGIKAAFAAGSKVILAGLGGMLIDEGRIYLEKSAIMTALVPHLFNPATAGWAAAGIGAALIGLGAALEGLASSGRNGGGGGYAAGGGTFTPNATPGGGMTVVVQVGDVTNRALVNSVTYEINRAGILNTPIVAPYGRPS